MTGGRGRRATAFRGRPGATAAIPAGRSARGQVRRVGDDAVEHAVGDRLLRAHPVIAVGVARHLLERLAGFARDDLVDPLAHLDDLARLDVDVDGRAAHAAHRLMQQEARVGQAEAPVLGAAEEDQRAGARHPARADDPHRRELVHEADHVVDGVAALHVAAGRVDVDVDRRARGAGQREQPARHVARQLVVDRARRSAPCAG